jgi:nucleoside phosphorylase
MTNTNYSNVLIVTATKVESKAVIEAFKETNAVEPAPIQIGDSFYHDLGKINQLHVFMARSDKGSNSEGGSEQTIRKGIEALSPKFVILVGIAFGVDEEKYAIGDILVSDQVWFYELSRYSTGKKGQLKIISRGEKVHAAPSLIARFESADLNWKDSTVKIHFGLIMSGNKLVDNLKFREQLKELEPEVIGGEMEGEGLYKACQDKRLDWIIVKSICDWADGNKNIPDKEKNQQLAANNAALFTRFALQHVSKKKKHQDGSKEELPPKKNRSNNGRLKPSEYNIEPAGGNSPKRKRINKKRMSPSQGNLSRQLELANNIMQTANQELFNRYCSIFLSDLSIPVTNEEYAVFNNICLSVTVQLREALLNYFQSVSINLGEDIAISIKLVLPPQNIMRLYGNYFNYSHKMLLKRKLWVITTYRDPVTYIRNKISREREVIQRLYSIEGNTAFKEIMQQKNDRFCCNDLMSKHQYENENINFAKQYNSTLVVPMVLDNSRNKSRYLGFLAVDSLNPNKLNLYERDECYWILNHAALVLSNFFLALILYHDIGNGVK